MTKTIPCSCAQKLISIASAIGDRKEEILIYGGSKEGKADIIRRLERVKELVIEANESCNEDFKVDYFDDAIEMVKKDMGETARVFLDNAYNNICLKGIINLCYEEE